MVAGVRSKGDGVGADWFRRPAERFRWLCSDEDRLCRFGQSCRSAGRIRPSTGLIDLHGRNDRETGEGELESLDESPLEFVFAAGRVDFHQGNDDETHTLRSTDADRRDDFLRLCIDRNLEHSADSQRANVAFQRGRPVAGQGQL